MEIEIFKNCSGFTDEQIKLVASLRCSCAFVACVVLIIVLVALVIISKLKGTQLCRNVIQRLTIWLTVVTAVYEFILAINIVYYFIPLDEAFCKFDGFMNQYFGSVQLIFALVISFIVFVQTTGEKWAGKLQDFAERNATSCTEVVFLLLVFIIPAVFDWIPFLTDSYGSTGLWCWIHSIEENCTIHRAGLAEQIALWTVPFALVAFLTLVFFVRALWLLCCRSGNAGRCYSITSLSFLLITCAMCILEVITRFYSFHRHDLSAWEAYAVSAPIGQVAIPLALLVPLHLHPLCTLYQRSGGYTAIQSSS